MTTALCFTDTETTHLSADVGHAWEIAVIRRDPDGIETEYLWQLNIDLTDADPQSLDVGRYHQRYAVPAGVEAIQVMSDGTHWKLTLAEMLFDFQDAVRDAILVGSNPGFDDRFLRKLMAANNRKVTWLYRPTCIANLAEGYLWRADPVWVAEQQEKGLISSKALSRRLGVEPPTVDVAHTALGDARWARDVFLAVTGGPVVPAERAGA
jgi:hypothetical protein